MKRILMVIIIIMCMFGCTNESGAKRVLEQNGYKNIQFKGFNA